MSTTFKSAVWLNTNEQEQLRHVIAEHISNHAALNEPHSAILKKIVDELGVAPARFASTKVSPDGLRSAMGQAQDAIPVRLSKEEIQTVLDVMRQDIPISVEEKFSAIFF